MATRIAKGFHRDEALGESPAVPFVPSTLGGNHYWCQMSKQRPSDNREAHAAGQLLAGLNQTKIPGNVDASAIRRSFAQRGLHWHGAWDESLGGHFPIAHRAGTTLPPSNDRTSVGKHTLLSRF